MKRMKKGGITIALAAIMMLSCGCGGDTNNTNNTDVHVSFESNDHTENSGSAAVQSDVDYSEEINRIAVEAQDAIDDRDYEAAMKLIRTALEDFPRNEQLSSLYVQAVKSQVTAYKASNLYDKALVLLEDAQEVVKENADIENLYEEIKKNMPDKLCDLKIVDSDREEQYTQIIEQTITQDTLGNVYDPGNLFLLKVNWKDAGGYAKYHLGGKYTSMGLTIATSDENPDDKNPTVFSVFGDGDKILFTSGEMTRTSEPVTVAIDVSGQDWLHIRVESTEYDSVGILMANPVLFE